MMRLLAAGCFSACSLSFAQVVHVKPLATVEGAFVRLRDVAVNPDVLPEGWGDRVVAATPQPGGRSVIALGAIAASLHPHADMQKLELRGQPEIRLSIRPQAVNADMLNRALADFLESQADWDGRLLRVSADKLPVVPGGSNATNAVVVGIRTNAIADGSIALIRLEGPDCTMPEEGWLAFPVTEMKPYWMVARPLLRGAVVTEGDMTEKWLPVEEGARYYPASESIVGMELRRNLQAGQFMHLGSLAAPVFVKRGEIVTVRFSQGGLTVSLRARALSDGRRAERIACVNERSGRRMYVRLVDVREALFESQGTEG
jgi:flagella basal body P-ring formation protein FlgA